MKKIWLTIIVMVLSLGLIGCKNSQDKNLSDNSKTEEEQNIDVSNDIEQVDETKERQFPYIGISFNILGSNFNEYALKRNMKFIDVSENLDYINYAGMTLVDGDIVYADLAKTDYEGYVVNDGIIYGKIVPKTFYNGSLASYLASEIDVTKIDTPLVINVGNKVNYLWECDNGYFSAVVLPTDEAYNYNPNYILLEISYYSDLEHCLWGNNIDFFLNQQVKTTTNLSDEDDILANSVTDEKMQDNAFAQSTDIPQPTELEQKLFDYVNYASDMSQEDIKAIYDAIEDGSFFSGAYFEYVTEYGKDRYNYEICYDGLTVIVYCDYIEDIYGFDISTEYMP